MAAHSDSLPTRIPYRTLNPSGAVWGGLALLVVLGAVLAFLSLGGDRGEERVWHAFHFNWLFWSSVAVGMVIFSMALHITNARWSWPLRRFALAGVSFLPASLVTYFIMWGGAEHYFHHWLHPEPGDFILEAKAAWLTIPGMFARDTVAVLVLYGLAAYFAYLMLRPDVHGTEDTAVNRFLTRGYRGAREEAERSRNIGLYVAPITAILFGILWGMIAIDQAMTMLPHWFSTMFPVTFLVSAFHSALAMTALMMTISRSRLGLHEYITERQYHDLGKLLFAYAVFWMYINWSQYVVIWYGLLPHEQEWFVRRFNEPFGPLVPIAVGCIFVIPFFFLLTRPPKKVPAFVAFVAVIILVGHWLERFLITVPSVWEAEGAHGGAQGAEAAHAAAALPLGIPELGMTLIFGGTFFLCYLLFVKRFPVLPSPASLAAIPAPMVTVQVPVRARPSQA